ncbi:MAG TPA: homoserine kinase [Gemmatimonadales bacterium]|nr:homoserine kinase [Gemmatimonadales bacterium]
MTLRSVTVRVPATSANLGSGFDCLGLALELCGTVSVRRLADAPPPVPRRSAARLVLEAFQDLYQAAGVDAPPLAVDYDGAVPLARGLGASAVLRVAGLLAANAFLGEPFSREQLLTRAATLERHADNAAPALFGGLQVIVRSEDGGTLHHVPVSLPSGLRAVLFIPDFQMPTQKSRGVLPANLSREDAVFNLGRTALLVGALAAGQLDLLDEATRDRLHQPARSRLFPAMQSIFQAARSAGALCAYLSGGGSTICALAESNEQGIAQAMTQAALHCEVSGATIITRPSAVGARAVGSS